MFRVQWDTPYKEARNSNGADSNIVRMFSIDNGTRTIPCCQILNEIEDIDAHRESGCTMLTHEGVRATKIVPIGW